jgi:hypothetical protein
MMSRIVWPPLQSSPNKDDARPLSQCSFDLKAVSVRGAVLHKKSPALGTRGLERRRWFCLGGATTMTAKSLNRATVGRISRSPDPHAGGPRLPSEGPGLLCTEEAPAKRRANRGFQAAFSVWRGRPPRRDGITTSPSTACLSHHCAMQNTRNQKESPARSGLNVSATKRNYWLV